MTSRNRDLMIGLTALIGLAVLAWMLLRFGELAGVGQRFHTITLRVESARGVSGVSPVSFNGVRVGDVTDIELARDGTGDALISLRIRENAEVPADFEVFLDASFVGESVLDLVAAEGGAGALIEGDGEVYEVEITSLAGNLTSKLASRLDAFDRTTATIERLANTYDDVGKRLAEVIDSESAEADDLRAVLTRIDRVLTQTEDWLDDGALLAEIRGAVDRFEASADAIAEETRALRARTETTLDNADSALVTADAAGAELREIAARINRGEGTLGQLATNPDLYNSLNAAVEQFQSMIRDARLLIEKYRDEGVPINL